MRKYWMVTLLLGAICAGVLLKIEAVVTQQDIARSVIRFHVLADSDSENDQKIKMEVKERVVAYLEPILQDAASAEESRALIGEHLDAIETVADDALKEAGAGEMAVVKLTKTWFPTKVYGGCTFPAGMYEALQVKIGSAKGKNWWCVLYPALCFEHSIRGVVTKEGKEKLSYVLTDEEMETILHKGKVKVRFRWF